MQSIRNLSGLLALLFGGLGLLQAQDNKLSYEDYLNLVQAQHPIARQIRMLNNRADAELQKARGGFDPMVGANWESKFFKESNYFQLFSSYISVPTALGLEVEGGYQYANGVYLNPESKLPDNGQAYLGLKLPLLQGLWNNERRLAVQQAKVLQNENAADVQDLLNNLLLQAALKYWQWSEAYGDIELIEEALRLSTLRFEAMRAAFKMGDKPAIDTLEAFINVQDRELRLQEAKLRLEVVALELATFLWDAQQNPLVLAPDARPVSIYVARAADLSASSIENRLNALDSLHPALQSYTFELQRLELERKVKANKILPKLELKYNLLSTNHVNFFATETPLENYKLGLKFSSPLFVRQARADLNLADIKIQETRFKREQKRFELENKIRAYNLETETLKQQILGLQQMVENYRLLLNAEQEKFRLGESSIFLLNTREQKWLESRQKLLQTIGKYLKAETGLVWAQGLLP